MASCAIGALAGVRCTWGSGSWSGSIETVLPQLERGHLMSIDTLPRGYTTRELAAHYRVSEDKIRAWIARGELRAVNTAAALSGKPRWVIPPEALAESERRRAGGEPAKPQCRRRLPAAVDHFPD